MSQATLGDRGLRPRLLETTRRARLLGAARILLLVAASGGAPGTAASQSLGDLGAFHKWHKVEIVLPGPASSVTASPNPFAVPVDVTFAGPGVSLTIPAFYDGDGSGGTSGNVWKVRFSPSATGSWSFSTASTEPALDGYTGTFSVDESPSTAPELLKRGRLTYAGDHYLRFADGSLWVKGGIDDPENFLGTAFGDWSAKRAAIDALSARGVNSIYAITNNIDGDRNDTWPWWGPSPTEAKANSDRFDVTKLDLWEDFFTYCESKGVVLHLILNDDSAWHAFDADLYYREMIARFGHHPGLIWNLGEEANEIYTDSEQIALAGTLRGLDPYDHPVTVHRNATTSSDWPFLGEPNFDLTSIQAGDGAADFTTTLLPNLNQIVVNHRTRSASAGRPIPAMVDETARVTSVTSATRFKMRAAVLYPIYLGGGSYELHYYDAYGPSGTVTIADLGPMLDDMLRARQFVQSLPLASMALGNNLLSALAGNYCLADPGRAYAVYLGVGGLVDLDLRGVSGSFAVTWYNVTTGAAASGGTITGGAWRSLGTPPFSGDVAVRIVASGSTDTTPPSAPSQLRAQ